MLMMQAVQRDAALIRASVSTRVPTVSRDAASKLLEGLPDRHSKARAQLRQQHQQHYAAWLFELEAGFSLCFYGFGSKRSLLKVDI
jgi:Origin recognition complex subunit 2